MHERVFENYLRRASSGNFWQLYSCWQWCWVAVWRLRSVCVCAECHGLVLHCCFHHFLYPVISCKVFQMQCKAQTLISCVYCRTVIYRSRHGVHWLVCDIFHIYNESSSEKCHTAPHTQIKRSWIHFEQKQNRLFVARITVLVYRFVVRLLE